MEIGDQRAAENRSRGQLFTLPSQPHHGVSGSSYGKTYVFGEPSQPVPDWAKLPMPDWAKLPIQPDHGVSGSSVFGEPPFWSSRGHPTILSDGGVSPLITLHVSSDRYPPSRFSTGDKRFRTTDKGSELDKSEIVVDSYPKRPMLFGPVAAPNKKTTGNGEASFDQSSNQATHSGDTEPNNTSIVTDDLGTDDITVEHLRQIFTPFGEFFCLLIIAGTRCGYAQFASRSSAEEAIRNLNGTELAGQKLRLSFANEEVCYKAIKTIAAGWAKAAPPVLDRDPPPPLFNLYKDVETGEMRIQTRVKDLGSDKSVIVDSCPKKTGGNGQASYDQSSNQATHSDTGLMTAFYKRIQVTHSGDRDLKIPNNTSILVDNLVPDVVTKEQLREIFTPYGEVGYVKVMAGTQFGFVQFVSRSCAEEAIKNLNGIELAGQNLKLSFSNKQERGAEYLDNGLPYGWSGSGIFRGLPPLVSDSGLPIEAGGWFSAPSPFMCERVVDPADPRLQPTHEDMESDKAILALYKRWCHANNVQRTPEEMQLRFGFFKKSAIQVFKANRDRPLGSCGLYIWADDPKKEPRGGLAG